MHPDVTREEIGIYNADEVLNRLLYVVALLLLGGAFCLGRTAWCTSAVCEHRVKIYLKKPSRLRSLLSLHFPFPFLVRKFTHTAEGVENFLPRLLIDFPSLVSTHRVRSDAHSG